MSNTSYGWCQLHVGAHAPFIHYSCESLAVQMSSAGCVPVTSEFLMNADHVHPDVYLNKVNAK